jgi:hypothetical protein
VSFVNLLHIQLYAAFSLIRYGAAQALLVPVLSQFLGDLQIT